MNAKPISEPAKPGCWSIGFVALFGSLFLFAGLAVIVTQVAMPWLSARAAADWPRVPCTILSSEIEEHRGDSTTYSVDIQYEYDIANQTHRSSQYDFSTMSRSRKVCRKILARYPEGKQSTCFVDPDNSAIAVLDRTPMIAWQILFLGGIFAVVGAIVTLGAPYALTGRNKLRRPISASGKTSEGVGGLSKFGHANSNHLYPEDVEDQAWSEPQRLKPASTKIGSLLGLVFLALFWNGIVGAVSFAIIGDGPKGVFLIFFILFLIPFVLIGLLIILGAIKAFLAMFNPVVEIALSAGAIARGSEVDVAWEIKGNAGRIRRLQIVAVGTEEARYRQGTNTVTATSYFGAIPIADTTEAEENFIW